MLPLRAHGEIGFVVMRATRHLPIWHRDLLMLSFAVPEGTTAAIGGFYQNVLVAPAEIQSDGLSVAHIKIGRHQSLRFRESKEPVAPYDGHHIAIYVANFSGPYNFLNSRHLISEDVRNHQFRFQSIIDDKSGRVVLHWNMKLEVFTIPCSIGILSIGILQVQRNYRRGRDALIPFRPSD